MNDNAPNRELTKNDTLGIRLKDSELGSSLPFQYPLPLWSRPNPYPIEESIASKRLNVADSDAFSSGGGR